MNLYTALVTELDPPDDNAWVQVFFARADHLGEALEHIEAAAREQGFSRPYCAQADPFDPAGHTDHATLAPSADAPVYWSTGRVYFPREEGLVLPWGVVPSCIEGELDADDLGQGFWQLDGSSLVLEAVVDRERLLDTWESLLRALEPYVVFWYEVHGHWDGRDEDVLMVNEALATPEAILDHVRQHPEASLLNGQVTLTAFSREGGTNVSLTDHRTLRVYTHDAGMRERAREALLAAGLPELPEPASIATGIHHWHVSPHACPDRDAFEPWLEGQGFSHWRPGGS